MSIFLGNLSTTEEAKTNSSELELQQLLHDIKSPIMAMMAGVNYIEKNDSSSEKAQDALNILKMATERLNSLTTPNTKIEHFPVLPAIQCIIAEKKLSGLKNITLVNDTLTSHLLAVGSTSGFKAHLSNLINNSLEAHASEVKIQTRDFANYIQISIKDDGCGIDKSRLNFIGKRGSYTSDKVGGKGLGLSNAMKQIKEWGGDLLIESQFGMGTTVTLLIKKA